MNTKKKNTFNAKSLKCPFPFQDLCQLKGQWKWETVENWDLGYLEKPRFFLTKNGNCSTLV